MSRSNPGLIRNKLWLLNEPAQWVITALRNPIRVLEDTTREINSSDERFNIPFPIARQKAKQSTPIYKPDVIVLMVISAVMILQLLLNAIFLV